MLPDKPRTGSGLPEEDGGPVFDRGNEELPWSPDDALPMDDDGNILPGNDPTDEDPNDNGDLEQNGPAGHPAVVPVRIDE